MLVSSFKRLIFFFFNEAMCLFGLKDTFCEEHSYICLQENIIGTPFTG